MDKLFLRLKAEFGPQLYFLEDKPEENLESTLTALWFVAAGMPRSVAAISGQKMPELNANQVDKLRELIQLKVNNTPLAHITGRQNFMGIDFICDQRALIPRKETEILGREALKIASKFSLEKLNINIIDVCCGAGNLGLAIASLNSKAKVFATDISEEAVELTKENIRFLNLNDRVSALPGDLFQAVENDQFYNKTDIIVCNPPYISSGKVKNMDPEILGKEPSLAFDGGMFGTRIIQRLISDAPKFLVEKGWLIFEVGAGQGDFVMQLCKRSDCYDMIEPFYDEHKVVRVIAARKLKKKERTFRSAAEYPSNFNENLNKLN